MLNPILERQILNELQRLDAAQQRVLEFTRELAESQRPQGVPSNELKRFAGLFSEEEAAEMRQAIEEDCERIDPDEW